MSSVTPKKPTSSVAFTPKKPSLKDLAFDPFPLPNDPQAIENSARLYHALISTLEGLLDVQDEVKEVADLLTGEHQHKIDTGFTFISKERRADIRNKFLRREFYPQSVELPTTDAFMILGRYEGPGSGHVEDNLISRAHNARVDSVYRRIRRLDAVEDTIRKIRTNLRLIRHHARVYDKHVPAACKSGEAAGCCWEDGGETLWDAELQQTMDQDEDMTEYMHSRFFTSVGEKEESDEGSSSDEVELN
ncbi:hypothetical protein V5O48_013313 [Marasmius crinis-equi]|uniref:Uncharacterized protein n=1 Tax=Marasmius crinis-equi TaxID=585013 RepID=A0ABR3F0L2_9AGAR